MKVITSSEPEAKESSAKVWVYLLNELDRVEADAKTKDWETIRSLLGGKGANLFEMTRLGLPVPPGFTVTTEACNAYLQCNHELPPGMWEQAVAAIHAMEKQLDRKFGDAKDPLLVSCRSGAKFSMPGMMDTVLNIGLNDETAEGMVKLSGDPRFVYDSYRRLIQMFASVVMGVSDEPFEEVIAEIKKNKGVKLDVELDGNDWKAVVARFKSLVKAYKGQEFPQDPYKQLEMATRAVFNSWFGKRAIDYRNATGISHELGTAVNIVTMVFGNMGNSSATGVAFTRNPVDGSKELYGDYLINAQGEDVVAGIRNTLPIKQLKEDMPELFQQFLDIVNKLEQHFRDMQDVEFTIERNKLWMLQTRNGKRTARASIKMAVDMVQEGLITKEEAVMRVSAEQVDQLLHPQLSAEVKKKAIKESNRIVEKAVNASPGAAVGMVVFDADTAVEWHRAGKEVIMVRSETKPDDVHGMIASRGILTSRGGATSHAAVVARQFGTPA
ncbi:MAG: pyruvate, phosphate dikinase, partial [Candidatus Obscuribacterales bacterium]|nr:pyruvate, phosphate dikinase [Candidatus Obscuribacterales bacterium]